ncbi:MAG: hypothetical protein MI723_10315, partial [Caulobacterales bacterium]|nr:hypothetical protein [Caulobacterales bacterium]
PLMPQTKLWTTPVDILHILAAERLDGEPLVERVTRRESRQTAFREGYQRLSAPARRRVGAFIAEDDRTVAALMSGVAPGDQAEALDVLLDYYAFAAAGQAPSAAVDQGRAHDLLLARIRLDPAGEEGRGEPAPPHAGQRSTLLQIAPLYNDELGAGVELRLRPAYNGFLSLTGGAAPYSELSMGDVRLVQTEDDLILRRFELVRVTALNLSATGVAPDGGPAWRFRAGFESRDLSCTGCTVAYVEGGAGRAARLGADAAVFAMATGRATAIENDDSYAQAGVTAGLIAGAGGPVAASLVGGALRQLDGPQDTLPFVQVESRFGDSPRWDLRLGVEHREALETRAGFSFYW